METPISKINILDTNLINMIAAGEVIERASSVVKELTENAVDAGADRIKIELVDAGLKEIKVTDNGAGMNEREIKMSVISHATSKINCPDDLFSIRTLGFRGEALPSIASVSNLKIKSCDGVNRGFMIGLKAGAVTSEAYIGYPRGTEVQVRNLFFNTPARLQSLKSVNTELSYVTDFVCKMALAHPDIAFSLANNGNRIFRSYGNGNLTEVLSNVYDADVAKNMIGIAGDNGIFKVSGLVSNPNVSRASRNNITVIVNGRVVRNYAVANAAINAYKTLLTTGRFPICVLDIGVDCSLVDVNVHPAKAEVRFGEEDKLLSLLTETISEALLRRDLTVTEEEPKKVFGYRIYNETALDREDRQEPVFREEEKEEEEIQPKEDSPEPVYYQPELDFIDKKDASPDVCSDPEKIGKLCYIGQLFGTYLLAQDDDNFYMIDQHAANERINYEKILRNLASEKTVTYDVMFPVTMTFKPNEMILIGEKMEALKELGLVVEEFGPNTVIIRSVPIWMSQNDIREYAEKIITETIASRKTSKIDFLDHLAKGLACKRSVKANEFLSVRQIDYLLEDLVKCKNPHTCPHGRPITVRLTGYQIKKWFKRVQ